MPSYKPVITFHGIYSKVLTSYSIDTWSIISTVAVLTIGRKLKQSILHPVNG